MRLGGGVTGKCDLTLFTPQWLWRRGKKKNFKEKTNQICICFFDIFLNFDLFNVIKDSYYSRKKTFYFIEV